MIAFCISSGFCILGKRYTPVTALIWIVPYFKILPSTLCVKFTVLTWFSGIVKDFVFTIPVLPKTLLSVNIKIIALSLIIGTSDNRKMTKNVKLELALLLVFVKSVANKRKKKIATMEGTTNAIQCGLH